MTEMSTRIVFQSHAGSIEASPRFEVGGIWMEWFQSHAGSIEAEVKETKPYLLTEFQSHAGSIEAAL